MNIIVLVKQVPDPEALVEIAASGKDLNIEPKFAINLFDEFALEEALRIKEKHGGTVKVIGLGGPKAIEALRTAIAMGADEAVLIEDESFAARDGYDTALVLSRALQKETYRYYPFRAAGHRQGPGRSPADGGPVSRAAPCRCHGQARYRRRRGRGMPLEGATDVIEVGLPAIFTAQKGLNEPSVPLITGVMKAMKVVRFPG